MKGGVPVGNEFHFFDEVGEHPLALVALCPPRHVVHVAERVNQHHVRVSPLVRQVAEHVQRQLEHELAMARQMDYRYHHVGQHVDGCDD